MTPDTMHANRLQTFTNALARNPVTSTMTLRQVGILLILHTTTNVERTNTVRALAEAINVAKPTVTKSLDRMQELGLIDRLPDHRDLRSIIIVLTNKGKALMAKACQPTHV